ncbi:MAG: substrate-binding domain-containing protein [Planctomycetes bacterium]|nr:substrate-binding domain-containing protein [Planctomycetota bacterium]
MASTPFPSSAKGGRPVRSEARFRHVAEDLRRRILAGEWPHGTAIPSLRSLAAAYREGQRTVRLAVDLLKEEGHIAANARRRLLAQPAPAGTSAAGGQVLVVLTENLATLKRTGGNGDILFGVQRGVGMLDSPLALAHGYPLRQHLPQPFLGVALRGIVVVGAVTDAALARYERLNVPVVLADRPPERRRLHAACFDNEAGMREALDRLTALGHRRIAFLRMIQMATRDVEPDSKERQAAFLKGLRERGLPNDPRPVFSYMSTKGWSAPALKALLGARPGYTAVVCSDPNSARAMQDAAEGAGLRVPDDLSVVCYQGKGDRGHNFAGPAIDFAELGTQAALLLKDPAPEPRIVRLAPAWIAGKTLTPPRTRSG